MAASVSSALSTIDCPLSLQYFCFSTLVIRTALKFFHLSSKQVDLRMKDTSENKNLIAKCPSLFEYTPSRLYTLDIMGHKQTALQTFIKVISSLMFSSIQYDRELLVLGDGGTVALDWVQICKYYREDAPTVIIMHGICGSSSSEYLIHIVEVLVLKGFRVVVMVARGCGGLRLTTPTPFSAERTSDFDEAVQVVHSKYPNSPLFAMGFSLGAGLTIKYMADYGDTSPVMGALSISPPWDFLYPNSFHFQYFWTIFLAHLLKIWAIPHAWMLGRKYWRMFFAPTLYYFDNIIAPAHGFKNADEYYKASSPINYVDKIKKPTLAISATDDPVCNINGCPNESSRFGPGLIVAVVEYGGHLSFAEKFFSYRCSWIDRVSVEWFNSLLG